MLLTCLVSGSRQLPVPCVSFFEKDFLMCLAVMYFVDSLLRFEFINLPWAPASKRHCSAQLVGAWTFIRSSLKLL